MKKRPKKIKSKKWIAILVVVLALLGIGGYYAYFVFVGPNYDDLYSSGRILLNPAAGLTDEEAIVAFDEEFVYYILVSIKAYNLHKPPFSSSVPVIEFYVDEDVYSAEIVEGRISVSGGGASDEDIVIRTSKLEGVRMVRSRNYVEESFGSGASSIELVAGETTLAGKGYLGLYTELTGKDA